jgi:hypothetical protein
LIIRLQFVYFVYLLVRSFVCSFVFHAFVILIPILWFGSNGFVVIGWFVGWLVDRE